MKMNSSSDFMQTSDTVLATVSYYFAQVFIHPLIYLQ